MQGKRMDRVGHLIQMELGQLILQKVKNPKVGFVTVTHVHVSPDLRNARVFFSVLGDETKKKESQIALEKAAGFFQREIGISLKLKYTPKLKFILDDSLDRRDEIDKVLKNIREGEKEV